MTTAETFVVANGKSTIFKDPDAILDYTYDWTDWLTPIADTIATRAITVPVGLTLASSSIAAGNLKVIAWLSGGTPGQTYAVACKITTAGARTDERTFYVKIKER